MAPLNRRHFLQFAGSSLAAIGLNEGNLARLGDRYGRVLATPTPRKVALLVGINRYPGGDALAGAVTDVELQRQLLIHRFGFQPADVHTLIDAQATRQNILAAFEDYLIRQAQPGDVVVFHFSGHGSRVSDQPDCDEIALKLSDQCLNSSFVPVDNPLPLTKRSNGGVVQDIGGHTLFLLMSALKTENVTVVLDCCYAGGGTRGNVRVRSLDGNPQLYLSSAEGEYRRAWLSRLQVSPAEYVQRRRSGVAKGAVIAAVGRDRLAADCPFDQFAAGAFTYTLTQYLWQQTGREPLRNAIATITQRTTQISDTDQVPEFAVRPNRHLEQRPVYFVDQPSLPAAAVVTALQQQQAKVWLGGVSTANLAAFDQGALFTAVDATGTVQGQLQLEPNSRQGLTARGRVRSPAALQPGSLLQEWVRGLPAPGELTLRLGLDPSLGAAITTAPAALQHSRVTIVPLHQNNAVQYILGRMTAAYQRELTASHDPPPIGSVGLFTATRLGIIADSFGPPGESVTAAIARLQPKFKSLLAVHLLNLILNPTASTLALTASITTTGSTEPFARVTTGRNASATSDRRELSLGTKVHMQVTNQESRDLYVSVLAIDAQSEINLLFPNSYTIAAGAALLKAGETLHIPDSGRGDRFSLAVQPPLGPVEILTIASTAPLQTTLTALQTVAARGEAGLGTDPAAVMDTVLADLQQTTRDRDAIDLPSDLGFRGVDLRRIATLSLSFISTPAA